MLAYLIEALDSLSRMATDKDNIDIVGHMSFKRIKSKIKSLRHIWHREIIEKILEAGIISACTKHYLHGIKTLMLLIANILVQ